MEAMDVDLPQLEMPGSGFQFVDLTNVFLEASAEMEAGEFMFMDDFSLQDAMGAFEIGEPRLDSGMIRDEERRPPFDPMTPLLPEELCWILDRSFSYEMEWHAGNLLSHSVFTLQYIHQLAEFEPDLIPPSLIAGGDPARPIELITVVLRAAVIGLLKSCDLSWRELSKGGVQDAEDWQGDKCEVSLLEGVPVKHVLSKLDEAGIWLLRSTRVSVLWRNALRARILLRKTLLQLMDLDVFKDLAQFQVLLEVARGYLQTIRSHPSPTPEPGSHADLAFDPFVSRRLNTFVPTRVIPVPTSEQTWEAVEALLDGWYELSILSVTSHLSTWEIVGNLRLWIPHPLQCTPYIRSSTQSIFYDGLLVLNKYSLTWLVDRFFFETLGITYDSIAKTIRERWTSTAPLPMKAIEHGLYKLITPHIRGLWYNPPRRRRHFMKSLIDWQAFYDVLVRIVDGLDTSDLDVNNIIKQIPSAALLWRLSTVREVIFSGFQLELYTSEEKPFAYWYAVQVIDSHLSCLDSLLLVVEKDSTPYREMQFQYSLLTALMNMSEAMFSVSMPLMSFAWQRTRPNFYRRYKWAFRPEYDDIETPVVAPPEIHRFMPACSEVLSNEFFSPSDSFRIAHMILKGLVDAECSGGWAGRWAKDRVQFVRDLADACERLYDLPTSMKDLELFDVGLLKWDPQIHPWFPSLSTEGAERRRNIHLKRVHAY